MTKKNNCCRLKDVVSIIKNDQVLKKIIKNVDPMESVADAHLDANAESSSKEMFEFFDKIDQDDVNIRPKSKIFLFEIVKEQIETLQKRFAFFLNIQPFEPNLIENETFSLLLRFKLFLKKILKILYR